MLNSLDGMIIVFAGMMAVALGAVGAMFLKKHRTLNRLGIYAASALALYISSVGMYITGVMFPGQMALCIVSGVIGIAAAVINLKSKNDEAKLRLDRLLSLAALVVAIPAAFL